MKLTHSREEKKVEEEATAEGINLNFKRNLIFWLKKRRRKPWKKKKKKMVKKNGEWVTNLTKAKKKKQPKR